jgi:hypothetical protein
MNTRGIICPAHAALLSVGFFAVLHPADDFFMHSAEK